MRLVSAYGLERSRLQAEYDQLMELIRNPDELLGSEALQMQLIKDEMLEIKARPTIPAGRSSSMPPVISTRKTLSG